MSDHFDFLIAGAGFAGSVLAERIASQFDKSCLVVEKRNHIGGNAYDCYDDSGVLIHKYGPHIFHTNSADVFAYLSQFTAWRRYEHRVLASVDGQLVPLLFHFGGIAAVINSDFLETLDFYPGNTPARYGRSIAGAVDINTRPGKRDRIHAYGRVMVEHALAMFE